MRAQQSLRDHRESHRQPRGQAGPRQGRSGARKLVLSLLADGMVDDGAGRGGALLAVLVLFLRVAHARPPLLEECHRAALACRLLNVCVK